MDKMSAYNKLLTSAATVGFAYTNNDSITCAEKYWDTNAM